MRTLLATSALLGALALAAPAGAVTVLSTSASGNNAVNVFATGPDQLDVDFDVAEFSELSATVGVTEEDTGSVDFSSFITVLTGVELGENLGQLDLFLQGGPTWDILGTIDAAFANTSTRLSQGDRRLSIFFGNEGESASVALGDVFGGGTDFGIALGGLEAGDSFELILNPQQVPAPAALALFGLGAAALLAGRRRRG